MIKRMLVVVMLTTCVATACGSRRLSSADPPVLQECGAGSGPCTEAERLGQALHAKDAAIWARDRAAQQKLRDEKRAAASAVGRDPGTIQLGDTQQYVRSQWGEPQRIDRTVSTYGVHEWWWYDYSARAIHFENGQVDSIHTSPR
jgi:hypothetical protein